MDKDCIFCSIAKGIDTDSIPTKQSDVVYRDKDFTVFIGLQSWTNNKGHVIMIPNKHIKDLYEFPESLMQGLLSLTKNISIKMKKAYKCDGITLKQNNEKCGGQTIFHFHIHIIPRYKDDHMDLTKYLVVNKDKRDEYACLLREALK